MVIVAGLVSLNDGVVQRRGRTAFSGDLGGDALIRSWRAAAGSTRMVARTGPACR